jgi:protein SCO1/2
MTRHQRHVFTAALVLTVILGVAVFGLLWKQSRTGSSGLAAAGVLLLPQARPLPALELTNQDGAAIALDTLAGHWTAVFFGYTYCPDICPVTLAQLRQIRSELAPQVRERLAVVMVTVDPQRDTPQQLKQYLAYYDPAFKGLTGTEQSLQSLARSLSIPYVPADTRQPGYTVQHSGNLALLGPDGQQRGFIRAPLNTRKLIEELPALLRGN